MLGKVTFRFDHLIQDYNKNETVADLYFDVLEYAEEEVFQVSVDGSDLMASLHSMLVAGDSEVLSKIKRIHSECGAFYVEEENLGGESVMKGGHIVFTEEETRTEHVLVIGDVYENVDLD